MRVRIRISLSFVLAASASLFGIVALAPAAFAAPDCSARNNYHVGYIQSGHDEYHFEGASSYIVVRNGTNCSGPAGRGRFVNSYVMIAGNENASGWGQVGFEKSEGKQLRWFSQFYDGADALDERYSTFEVNSEIGVRHTFRVLYVAPGRLRATIDSTSWDTSAFNPYQVYWGPFPWSPQFTAEGSYTASAIPGIASAPTEYTGMGAQSTNEDVVSMPCILSALSDSSKWKHAASSCTAANVWTE